MKTFKAVILFLHRWLGLISGIVVFILGVTGCLFVFHHEISQWTRGELLQVEAAEQQHLPIKQLQQKAVEALEVESLSYGITTYKDPNHSWSTMYYKGGAESWTYFGMMEDYRTLYINQYNGEIKGIVNEKEDFFQIVKGIHWSLLLATPIGQPIVVWSTVIFLVLLVTGMVLWWPKRWNKRGRQKSFNIRWKGTWRRVNYDLHNVLGFYFLLITLILGLTGLYWAFPAAQKSMYFIATGEYQLPTPPTKKIVSDPSKPISDIPPLKKAYNQAWKAYPAAYSVTLIAPTDSLSPIRAAVQMDGTTYYEDNILFFDQYTGRLLHKNTYASQNAGEKLLSMNYDIHVGAIAGMPGKIIAFLASLLSASLPVTGFIIWWDREQRKKKSRRRKASQKRNRRKKKSTSKKKPVSV